MSLAPAAEDDAVDGMELSLTRPGVGFSLRRFSRWGRPVPSLPMVWVYGSPVAMPMALPLLLAELPSSELSKLSDVQAALDGCAVWDRRPLDAWLMLHTTPSRAACQKAAHELKGEVALDEINVSHHAWLFENLDAELAADPSLSVSGTVWTGLFRCVGVEPSHQDLPCRESRGMAFAALEPREVLVHGGGCFSPCNCMLRLQPEHSYHSFASVSLRPTGGRAAHALVLHLVPASQAAESRLRAALTDASAASISRALHGCEAAGASMLELLRVLCGDTDAWQCPAPEELAALPAAKAWTPPSGSVQVSGNRDHTLAASQLVEMGFSDFDVNMEVLRTVDGDLTAALAFLQPA